MPNEEIMPNGDAMPSERVDEFGPDSSLETAIDALDPTLSEWQLAKLGQSDELITRTIVAGRPNTPVTTLAHLAADGVPAVRASVARNPRIDIPIEIRETLARDKSSEVLHALIGCKTIPESILLQLSRSWRRDISSAAKTRRKSRKAAMEDAQEEAEAAAARVPALGGELGLVAG